MSLLVVDRDWHGRPVTPAAVHLAAIPTGLRLRVAAPLAGDPPPDAPPGPTPRLWEHEVVELFLAGSGPAYLEVELGPHGHHLVLRLADVRRATDQGLALDAAWARDRTGWAAVADLPAAWLPPPPWRAAAFRIHGPPGARAHLVSAPLPGAAPDFHQPAAFPALAAPAPDDAAGARALLAAAAPSAAAAVAALSDRPTRR